MLSPSGLKTIFFGTPEFAAYVLRRLIEAGEEIVAVVTAPAKPKGRGLETRETEVSAVARENEIPVLSPASLKDEAFLHALEMFHADCFCVVAFRILPVAVFSLPRYGSFNVHGSLLPKYRGAAPINWAIIRGERETGVTTFLLQEKVDTGNILLRRSMPIGPNETAGELHDRMKVVAAELAIETLKGLAQRTLHPIPQTDSESTTAPKIFPRDCEIEFNRPGDEVHNFIRGLAPSPGASTVHRAIKLKFLGSELTNERALPAGTYLVGQGSTTLLVGTADRALRITKIQREGKKVLSTAEFLRGNSSLFLR